MNIEPLPEICLGDRRDGIAKAAIPELETATRI
jgi:hypothetical protein